MGAKYQRTFNQAVAIENKFFDDNGFLVNVNVPIARSGIYNYKGLEFGLVGNDAYRDIIVYRPVNTYTPDVLEKFSNIPVTNDHPRDAVTPQNFKQETVGVVGGRVYLEGDNVIAEKIIIQDQSAINAIENDGKKELSIGFNAEYDFTPGMTADGEPYDGIEKIISANHIAIVEKGKAGSFYRLNGDFSKILKKEELKMELVTRNFKGIPVEMTNAAAAAHDELVKELQKNSDQSTLLNTVIESVKNLTNAVAEIKTLVTSQNKKNEDKDDDDEEDANADVKENADEDDKDKEEKSKENEDDEEDKGEDKKSKNKKNSAKLAGMIAGTKSAKNSEVNNESSSIINELINSK